MVLKNWLKSHFIPFVDQTLAGQVGTCTRTTTLAYHLSASLYKATVSKNISQPHKGSGNENDVLQIKWATTWQNQQSDYAPSEDSDQTGRIDSDQLGHPPSLIIVFAVRSMGS